MSWGLLFFGLGDRDEELDDRRRSLDLAGDLAVGGRAEVADRLDEGRVDDRVVDRDLVPSGKACPRHVPSTTPSGAPRL